MGDRLFPLREWGVTLPEILGPRPLSEVRDTVRATASREGYWAGLTGKTAPDVEELRPFASAWLTGWRSGRAAVARHERTARRRPA